MFQEWKLSSTKMKIIQSTYQKPEQLIKKKYNIKEISFNFVIVIIHFFFFSLQQICKYQAFLGKWTYFFICILTHINRFVKKGGMKVSNNQLKTPY